MRVTCPKCSGVGFHAMKGSPMSPMTEHCQCCNGKGFVEDHAFPVGDTFPVVERSVYSTKTEKLSLDERPQNATFAEGFSGQHKGDK